MYNKYIHADWVKSQLKLWNPPKPGAKKLGLIKATFETENFAQTCPRPGQCSASLNQ